MVARVDVTATVSPSTIVGFPSGFNPSRLGADLLGGDDWQAATNASLASDAIWEFSTDSATSTPPKGDSAFVQYTGRAGRADPEGPYISVVSDPTFVQAVQCWFPYSTGNGLNPAAVHLTYLMTFAAQTGKVWFRLHYNWRNGYTTVGDYPTSGANSHKLAFIGWAGGVGQRMEVEYSNTVQYLTGMGQAGKSHVETNLPGSAQWANANSGTVDEWVDNRWWQIIGCYSIETPGADGQSFCRWWKRLLTNAAGVIENNAYEFYGVKWDYTAGSTPAEANSAKVFANRNKTVNPVGGHQIWIGPVEVSKASDPYSLDFQGRS